MGLFWHGRRVGISHAVTAHMKFGGKTHHEALLNTRLKSSVAKKAKFSHILFKWHQN